MTSQFIYDPRLGIKLPRLSHEWDLFDIAAQEKILMEWETIRGSIPDRMKELEEEINQKQSELYEEENFERSCRLNSEIADLASTINDLWIWYRTNQRISR